MYRTLRLIIGSFKVSLLTEEAAQELVQRLADSDARFPPAARENLFRWARSQQLL